MPIPQAPAAAGRAPAPDGIGLILPTFPQQGPPPTAGELAALCRDAEAAGAAGLWACDHLFWHGPSTECLTALAVAAAASTDAVVGSCVLQLPLRRPGPVAKAAASLQQLSGGRFVLGVGVGTHPGEYAAAGVDYERRGSLLDEGVEALRAAWSGGAAAPYRVLPAGDVPVWVGGSSAPALRRAARHQGWVPLFVSPADYGTALRRIRAGAERAGRDPDDVFPAVVAFVSLGREAGAVAEAGTRWMSTLYGLPARAFGRHLLAGDAPAVAGELMRWVEQGARHVVVFVTDDHPLSQFADLSGELADRGLTPGTPADRGIAAGVR